MSKLDIKDKPIFSNSRLNAQSLPLQFKVSVDRITIMGDLDEKTLFLLEDQLQNPMFLMRKAFTSSFIIDVQNVVHVEYDKFKAKSFNRRNMRVDFNPNNLSVTDKLMIWDVFVSKMKNKSFSRLDIAFDTTTDLTNYYIDSNQAMKETYLYGMNGQIETRYFGSRKSDRYLRIYNKKKQLKEVKKVEIEEENQWRIEFELKRTWTDRWIECLEGFHFTQPDWTTLEKLNDRAMVYMLLNEKDEWGKLHRNTKTKYRKIIREISSDDLIDDMQTSLDHFSNAIRNQLIDWLR